MLEEWTPSPCAPTLCSNWYLEVYTVHYNTNPKGAAVTSVGPQPPPMTFGDAVPRLTWRRCRMQSRRRRIAASDMTT